MQRTLAQVEDTNGTRYLISVQPGDTDADTQARAERFYEVKMARVIPAFAFEPGDKISLATFRAAHSLMVEHGITKGTYGNPAEARRRAEACGPELVAATEYVLHFGDWN